MKQYFCIIIIIISSLSIFSQQVPDGIIHAFEKGDAKELTLYMHDNIELKILEKEYVTSKNQASRIIEKFFHDYPPLSFKVNYDGSKKESNYSLGKLKSQKALFNVNLYFMEGKKNRTIYYLSIEKI